MGICRRELEYCLAKTQHHSGLKDRTFSDICPACVALDQQQASTAGCRVRVRWNDLEGHLCCCGVGQFAEGTSGGTCVLKISAVRRSLHWNRRDSDSRRPAADLDSRLRAGRFPGALRRLSAQTQERRRKLPRFGGPTLHTR